MNHSVMIKGTKSGLILVLDKNSDYEELKQEVAKKFDETARFLGEAVLALTFEGRELDTGEQQEIIQIIEEHTQVHIDCVVEQDEKLEAKFEKSLNEHLMELENNTGMFHKGTLRSGVCLEFESSVVILGDVKEGAKVVSKGNIVILGSLKGNAFAGASGNPNSFVVALDMDPIQIRIADIIARSPDEQKKKKSKAMQPKIAYIDQGNIYIEPLDRESINDIQI